MSRVHRIGVKCVASGCNEFTIMEYSRRDRDIDTRIRTYRCVRHSHEDEVLTPGSPLRTHHLRVVEKPYGKFWTAREDGEGGSGFIHGPGFRAFADDFPTGTVLEVTARIVPLAEPAKEG